MDDRSSGSPLPVEAERASWKHKSLQLDQDLRAMAKRAEKAEAERDLLAAKVEQIYAVDRDAMAMVRAERDALTTELEHTQGSLADTRQEVDDLTGENRRLRDERDALQAAIKAARTRVRLHLSEAEGQERVRKVVGQVYAEDLRRILADLDAPEASEAKDDDLCGEEREEYGRVITCTRPKGHDAHIAYKHGTAWTYLPAEEQASAPETPEWDRVYEIADDDVTLAPETPGDETEDRS
jgi:hypothetical protein